MTATESIVWQPIDVRNEVAALGLEYDGLVESIRYAENERAFVTANDAVGFASLVAYDKCGRAMRERFLGKEWTRDDSNNQCAILNKKTKTRVVPCNFDEFAGNRLVTPTNRSPKGEVSRKKSLCNRTAWIPGLPKIGQSADDGIQTWLLGIFMADDRPTTAELSLPIGFDGYHFTDFGKRIILLNGEGGSGAEGRHDRDDDKGPIEPVDIVIRRK